MPNRGASRPSPRQPLELHVEAESWDQHRAAVAIVAGIVNVLQVWAREDSPPHVRVVVGLENGFPAVIQGSVAEQEALPSQFQIMLVVGRDSVRHKDAADLIQRTMPRIPGQIGAERLGF